MISVWLMFIPMGVSAVAAAVSYWAGHRAGYRRGRTRTLLEADDAMRRLVKSQTDR